MVGENYCVGGHGRQCVKEWKGIRKAQEGRSSKVTGRCVCAGCVVGVKGCGMACNYQHHTGNKGDEGVCKYRL